MTSRSTESTDLAALAHHEAGHAIVWELCGIEIDRITHYSEDLHHLAAATHPRTDGKPLSSILLGLAAGHVAETMYLGPGLPNARQQDK